ncbi:AfsR/SARP family transcriptional regulator [Actinoplanes couchii]|uniref:OmpR/PhoB-type domain-containing protein n=1 Tax=Actinoplanes couchii TaxID=403638 RepID=A0ABQ3XNT7_9ACTN|nr:BTAD domain-containing putative transcriptional regulator [Actinoplanes couchii]MDR6319602.1 DNA-binding SARP family transcriptional activator [Actinoplanes couchii]GID60175.1 hypothetical protein Aco03nite_085790 [Actinoplanes couchii]
MLESAGKVRLAVLGPVRILRDGIEVDAGPRQQRALLAVLMASPGRPLDMLELTAALWGDDPPASAVNVIHKYIGALRRVLEPRLAHRDGGSFLLRDGGGYRLTAGPGSLDLLAFRDRVTRARGDIAAGRPETGLDRYLDAFAQWRGPAGDRLARTAAARRAFLALHSEFFDAVVTAAAVAVELRRPARILGALRLAASIGGCHEAVYAALMLVLAATGNRARALDLYRGIRDTGLDPGPELRQAHRRVLTRTVLPLPTAVPVVRPTRLPPDPPDLAGRDTELDTLRGLVGDPAPGRRTGPLVVAMDGEDPAGTSALAVHFAHLAAADFPDGRLYLDLRRHDRDESLTVLLTDLGLPGTREARADAYRDVTATRRILLVLDHVHDHTLVPPLLPVSTASLVLVTSPHPLPELTGARFMTVDPVDVNSTVLP